MNQKWIEFKWLPEHKEEFEKVKDHLMETTKLATWDKKLPLRLFADVAKMGRLGYILTQLPGGWVATRLPPLRLLLVAVFSWSLATLLTPPAARLGARLRGARLYAERVAEPSRSNSTRPDAKRPRVNNARGLLFILLEVRERQPKHASRPPANGSGCPNVPTNSGRSHGASKDRPAPPGEHTTSRDAQL